MGFANFRAESLRHCSRVPEFMVRDVESDWHAGVRGCSCDARSIMIMTVLQTNPECLSTE